MRHMPPCATCCHTASPRQESPSNHVSLCFPLSFKKRSLVLVVKNGLGSIWRKLFCFSPTVLCVMSCGFFTDSREETVLGSIPLPSYVIAPVEPDDHINRKYAFKVTVRWH